MDAEISALDGKRIPPVLTAAVSASRKANREI